MNVYETDKLVSEYLLFHYGKDEEVLPWANGPNDALGFPLRTVSHFSKGQVSRALDLGCAVGRSAFVMAEHAEEVIGIDFSEAFIIAADRLSKGEKITYRQHVQAGKFVDLSASISSSDQRGRVFFEVGNAMELRPDLGSFDRVHAANLICRLPEPSRLLERLPDLVNKGGELVLATPCTWLDEFTPSENWPTNGDTFTWLKRQLEPEFELVSRADEPFLIRETERKFQWTVSLVSKWRRV